MVKGHDDTHSKFVLDLATEWFIGDESSGGFNIQTGP